MLDIAEQSEHCWTLPDFGNLLDSDCWEGWSCEKWGLSCLVCCCSWNRWTRFRKRGVLYTSILLHRADIMMLCFAVSGDMLAATAHRDWDCSPQVHKIKFSSFKPFCLSGRFSNDYQAFESWVLTSNFCDSVASWKSVFKSDRWRAWPWTTGEMRQLLQDEMCSLTWIQTDRSSESNTYNPYQYNSTYQFHFNSIIEGSLEVKLPTIWTDGRAEVGRVREERSRREKIREERGVRKGSNRTKHCVFSDDLWLRRVEK